LEEMAAAALTTESGARTAAAALRTRPAPTAAMAAVTHTGATSQPPTPSVAATDQAGGIREGTPFWSETNRTRAAEVSNPSDDVIEGLCRDFWLTEREVMAFLWGPTSDSGPVRSRLIDYKVIPT